MLTADDLMRAHADGELTRTELFVHLISLITPANIEEIMAKLGADESCAQELGQWLDDITRGAQVFAGKRQVLTADARAAALAWRSQTRDPPVTSGDRSSRVEGAAGRRDAGPRRVVIHVDSPFLSTIRTTVGPPQLLTWNDTDTYSNPSADRVACYIKDIDVLASRTAETSQDGPQR